MANPKPKCKFTPEQARAAGKKSSRAIPPDLKQAREQNKGLFEATIYKYLNSTKEELKLAIADPKTPARDLLVLSILQKAVVNGDHMRGNFLLERTEGKVTEKVETVDKTKQYEKEELAKLLLEIARKPE